MLITEYLISSIGIGSRVDLGAGTYYILNDQYEWFKKSGLSFTESNGVVTWTGSSGNTYKLYKSLNTWDEANALASREGGYLVKVDNSQENEELFNLTWASLTLNDVPGVSLSYAADGGSSMYVWLGASDVKTEGQWVWERDGTTLPISHEGWGSGSKGSEPDNFRGSQDYLALGLENWAKNSKTGEGFGDASEWNDISGANKMWFIVEFDQTPVAEDTTPEISTSDSHGNDYKIPVGTNDGITGKEPETTNSIVDPTPPEVIDWSYKVAVGEPFGFTFSEDVIADSSYIYLYPKGFEGSPIPFNLTKNKDEVFLAPTQALSPGEYMVRFTKGGIVDEESTDLLYIASNNSYYSASSYQVSVDPAYNAPTSSGSSASSNPSVLEQGNYTLNVIVNLFGQVLYLQGLKETITSTTHSVEYAGTIFNWSEVDSFVTTVTRDGNFTDEFAKEIADAYPSVAGISYSTAVALVGASAIDDVLLAVAGADGNYVG